MLLCLYAAISSTTRSSTSDLTVDKTQSKPVWTRQWHFVIVTQAGQSEVDNDILCYVPKRASLK